MACVFLILSINATREEESYKCKKERPMCSRYTLIVIKVL